MKAIAQVFIFLFFLFLYTSFAQSSYASDITSAWFPTTSLPYKLASHVAFSLSGKSYVLGGSAITGQSHSNIPSATSESNGLLGQWSDEAFFPSAPIYQSIARTNDDIYILGGLEENPGSANGFVNKVYYSKNGVLNSWMVQSSLPQNLGLGAATVIDNRIYYSGGFNRVQINKKVYTALINSDGSLGIWTQAGEMPEPRLGHSMLAYNGHLIILGGDGLSTVYVATPDQNGLITSWQQTSSFPTTMYRASMQVVGKTIISVGGYDGISTIDRVYHTTIHDDGTIDPWQLSSNHLPSPVHAGGTAIVGDYLYLIGGYNSITGSYLNSVYYTKLNTSNDISLNVPLIKQTNPLWKDLEYDSAHLWAGSQPITIGRWGCALTSAAMVLQYNGITKLPDGTDLNPETLNTWLKNEKDGYFKTKWVKTGWVNWQKIANLGKLAKSQNPNFNFDSLEFRNNAKYDLNSLKTDLQNNIPDIIEEPGHFVVAKGTSGSTIAINDPGFNKDLLTDYSSTFSAQKRFIPSHSDMSYIILFSLDDLIIKVKDSFDNVVGEYTKEQRIASLDGDGFNSSKPLNVYYVPKPENGEYKVEVTAVNTNTYELGGFLYDINGNVETYSLSGAIAPDQTDTYKIVIDKQNVDNSLLAQNFSFSSITSDLAVLYDLGLFKNFGIYNAFKVKTQQALEMKDRDLNASKEILSSLLLQLEALRGSQISETAYQILKPEISGLLGTL